MFLKIFDVCFVVLCNLVVCSVNCCHLAIEDKPEPKHLAEYHANFRKSGYYWVMPETPNDMEGILECHHSCSENAEYVWQNIDFNIVFEVYCRLKDGDQYFIDKYIRRFDSFMQLVSRNEYKDVIPLLFHRPPYNMGLVDSLSIECFSILRISEYPNTSLEMIFRMTKGLDTSLRRNPIYIRDYVDHNASLIWAYETLIASPDLGPAYQAISTEVEKMLTDGITIGKE